MDQLNSYNEYVEEMLKINNISRQEIDVVYTDLDGQLIMGMKSGKGIKIISYKQWLRDNQIKKILK